MSTAHLVVTVVAAFMAGFSAGALLLHAKFVTRSLADYGVPRSWWPWLGTAKALGAIGLIVGVWLPIVGILAAGGLIVYFAGAAVTVTRAHWYAHIPYPLLYLAPAVGSLALAFAI